MPGITDEIQRNRRDLNQLESYLRVPSPEQSTTINAPGVRVSLNTSGVVHTRPINESLIVGHPDASNQPGRATVGDRRGSWSQVATSTDGFVPNPVKKSLATALTGAYRGISHAAIQLQSTGATSPQIGTWYDLGDPTTTTIITDYRTNDIPDTFDAIATYTNDGSFALGPVFNPIDPAINEEVKINVDLSISTSSNNDAAVTDPTAISNALASPAYTVGLNKIAIGSLDDDPTSSDTSLAGEVIRKNADHNIGPQSVIPWTIIFRSEPNTQPHTIEELGVFDGNGTLVWRSVFPYETKNERTRMRPQSTLRIE